MEHKLFKVQYFEDERVHIDNVKGLFYICTCAYTTTIESTMTKHLKYYNKESEKPNGRDD